LVPSAASLAGAWSGWSGLCYPACHGDH
jgi:hypothetical protein